MSKSGDDAGLNHLVVAQLSKTKMCAMFARGSCHDAACRFSHSLKELRAPPDLTKTAMCRAFARGECHDTKNCKFAHGESELRVTESVYKTQLCNFFMRGHCKKGNRCRHAHGNKELRSFRPEVAAKVQKPTELKPLSPGRVDSQGGERRYPERQLWEMLSAESSLPSLPSSPTVQTPPTSHWPVDCLGFDDGLEREAHLRPSSPVGVEVPMKVPLPLRPHAGIEGFDTPSRSLVPTPPLAGYSPLAATPDLPWRNDPLLTPMGLDYDAAGLAAAMAAAAMEHTAAAKLASVHTWNLASAAMKANCTDLSHLRQVPTVPTCDPDKDLVASLPMPRFAERDMFRRYI